MRSIRLDFRFLTVVALLLSAALVLQARSRREIIAPRLSLSKFPSSLGSWVGTDVTLDKETLDILGPGDFLLREYQNTAAPEVPVDLFIAYFPSQRTGDTIHSPKHCLPGAGWLPIESSRITLTISGRRSFPANRYLIARGDQRELVFYWYQAHDRVVASEYWAKFYLIADAIRMNRSDGSLVRLATPLATREPSSHAETRLLTLATQVVPLLNSYVPR
jgi:EpsI family protein